MQSRDIHYVANKTGRQFHRANKFITAWMGPVGSGKSVGCLMRLLELGLTQHPNKDGIRQSRFGIIRKTYPELKTTTIKTYEAFIKPQYFGHVKKDIPMSHRIRIDDVDMEFYFISVDSEQDVEKLSSFEFSAIWLNEARELNRIVLIRATERVGRYPRMEDGGFHFPCILMDTNPPDDEHWFYHLFEVERPENAALFKSPAGLLKIDSSWVVNPDADNIENLPHDYYINMLAGKKEEEIKVQILGQYGILMEGRPVYPDYNDNIHLLKSIPEVNRMCPIRLGWDFGLTPACTVSQLLPNGKWIIFDEIYTDDMALRQFVETMVLPYLNEHYPHWKKGVISRADPAGAFRSQTDEKTCIQILNELGIETERALSNIQTVRKDAVHWALNKMVGGEPFFQLSPKCKRSRKGFMSGYQYKLVSSAQGRDVRYHEEPLKNHFSHTIESIEYQAMEVQQMYSGGNKQKESDLMLSTIIN